MLPRSLASLPFAFDLLRLRSFARPLALAALATLGCAGCGMGGDRTPSEPFVAHFPDEGPGVGSTLPVPLPPPVFPRSPVWTEDAFSLDRTALFGSFPSDLSRLGSTLFVSDADAIEADGARIVPIEIGGSEPAPSARFATTVIHASDLVDSTGAPGDAASPIGFGFFLNDLAVVSSSLGFVLANAGGSDSAPACSNLVVFDPTTGAVRQVVDLANPVAGQGPLFDSSGAPVPGDTFTQSGSEGVEYVPTGNGHGLLFVAMSNFLFGPPSFGAIKCPGTVQVFDVTEDAVLPVSNRPAAGFATRTLLTHDFNPVAVTRVHAAGGHDRILVTEAGTTGYDASFSLVPVTPASVEVFDVPDLQPLGRFDLGLAGLSGIRPAIGRDAIGHDVAWFASSVRGEVYLLRIDGLTTSVVIPSLVSVLRGPMNAIPIDPAAAGGPGGNVAGLAQSSDGKTLVVSGFGDLFAFPVPKPGRLLALSLPNDLVSLPAFGPAFVPGTSNVVTTSGRTLGPVVVAAVSESGPEVFVAVGGSLSTTTFFGDGPASVGTLQTFGRIR